MTLWDFLDKHSDAIGAGLVIVFIFLVVPVVVPIIWIALIRWLNRP